MQGLPVLSWCSAAVILLSFCLPSFSQDFSVPSTWRKPTSDYTRSDLNNIAQGIIDTVSISINSTNGLHPDLLYPQNANLMVGIATHDALVAGLKNQGTVIGSLQTVEKLNHLFWRAHQWSLAVHAAYRAYGSSDSLNLAMSIWDAISVYQISPENASSGTHPQKNGSFSQMCNGASTAGGVFRFPDNQTNVLDQTSVNSVSVCTFLVLSARLYEVTQDSKYAAAAEQAAQFIMSQLYNGSIIQDTIYLSNCTYNTVVASYNTGFFIEGLSVYANVTQNSTWTTTLNKVLFTATNFPSWTRYDGIMIEDAKSSTTPTTFSNDFTCGFKAGYIRGLFEMWTRMTDSKVKNFLQSYLTVQLNALLDLARLPGTNQFSSSWSGPYPLNLDTCGQFAALDVFNAAIGLIPVPNNTSSSPASETSLSSGKSTNVGLIVGVTIAAVVVVLVAAFGGFIWWRRRGRHASEMLPRPSLMSETGNTAPTHVIEPFVAQIPTSTSSASPQGYLSEKIRLPPTQPNSHSHSDLSTQSPGGGPAPRSEANSSTRLYQSPASLTTSTSNYNQPSSHSRDLDQVQGESDAADPSQIPQLIRTLNQALARLPPELVAGPVDGENPPEYVHDHER